MELWCRFPTSPVNNTYPVDYIPWVTFDIPWTYPVDYIHPVGDISGELISRGYDIPWTTCTHGIWDLKVLSTGYIPWTISRGKFQFFVRCRVHSCKNLPIKVTRVSQPGKLKKNLSGKYLFLEFSLSGKSNLVTRVILLPGKMFTCDVMHTWGVYARYLHDVCVTCG